MLADVGPITRLKAYSIMTKPFDIPASQTFEHPGPNPAGSRINKPLKQRLRPWLMVGVPILFVALGYAHFMSGQAYVSTDNAYARVAKASINARISGQVLSLIHI